MRRFFYAVVFNFLVIFSVSAFVMIEPASSSINDLDSRLGNAGLKTGERVFIVLQKLIPNFESYLQVFIDNVDDLDLVQEKNKAKFHAFLGLEFIDFVFSKREQAQLGDPYSIVFHQKIFFDLVIKNEKIILDRIKGVELKIKVPFLMDGFLLKRIAYDPVDEKISIKLQNVEGVFTWELVFDLRFKQFITSLDWKKTIQKNLIQLGCFPVCNIFERLQKTNEVRGVNFH